MVFSCMMSVAAGVVELVDALRSGRSIRKDVPVRVRPSALYEKGERWRQPSFPFFVGSSRACEVNRARSAQKRGGPDVIRERRHPEDIAERDIGGTTRLVHELRGADHLFLGRFRDPGS